MIALAREHEDRPRRRRRRDGPGQVLMAFAVEHEAPAPLPSDDLGIDPDSIGGDAPFSAYAEAIESRIAALKGCTKRYGYLGSRRRSIR